MGKMKERKMEIDEVIERVRDVWYRLPHLRLGQLISNAMPQNDPDTFYVEDEILALRIERFGDRVRTDD